MSDIGLNLSGIIALLVFFGAAAGLALAGIASLLIAYVRGEDSGFKKHGAFLFFLAALPLIAINLIEFGILVYSVDSNERETNEFLDKAAAYVWLPLQPIIWIILGIFLKRVRR